MKKRNESREKKSCVYQIIVKKKEEKEIAFFHAVAVALLFDFSNYEFERSIGTLSRKESQRTCQKLRNPLLYFSSFFPSFPPPSHSLFSSF